MKIIDNNDCFRICANILKKFDEKILNAFDKISDLI